MNRYSHDSTRLLNHQPLLVTTRTRSADWSTLETELGVSRAIAYHQTSTPVDEGLLKRTNRGYRMVDVGTTALGAAEYFKRSLVAADRLKSLFEHLSPPALIEDLHLFANTTVMTVDSGSPYAIGQRLKSIIGDIDERIYGVATSFGSPMTPARTVNCVEGSTDLEWALPQTTLERLECQHGELHEVVRTHGNVSVYIAGNVANLSLYDDTLVFIGFDIDRGALAAAAMTDSSAAVDWACSVFETHREYGE